MVKLREENQGLHEEKVTQQVVQQRLKSENSELWAQLEQHKEQIESLGRDLREMQKHCGLQAAATLDPPAEEQVEQACDWSDELLQVPAAPMEETALVYSDRIIIEPETL